MCLDTITKKFDTPDPEEKIGYKVVRRDYDKYQGWFYSYGLSYSKNEWYSAEIVKIQDLLGRSYESGFHIYTDSKQAVRAFHNEYEGCKNKVLVKVIYSDVTCAGIQDTYEVAIANKMKIVEEICYDRY